MPTVAEFVMSVAVNSLIVYLIFKVLPLSNILFRKSGQPANPENPVKQEKQDYKYALGVAFLASSLAVVLNYILPYWLFDFALILGYLLDIALVKYIYTQNWIKSFIAGTAWWILGYLVVSVGLL